ncbi:protein GLUTAMINE DUMPER 2-like [Vigna unguiculata]|uniref:protein GLUTAMINE DUMPER 2-like n=1 Tax=Vigna unguiculata TaxID=3917 RepID=UPI001015DFA7|nr:protein GLUTAMINE DUMPER 2-like [Vigna unguiculata]
MRSIPSTTTSTSTAPTGAASPPHPTWHSPVPYLFGGLAAMLGLIAFALLILACSYWKISGALQNEENGERNVEKLGDSENKESVTVYEEKILVIMAGDEKPTFLATPKASSVSRPLPNHFEQSLQHHVTSQKSQKEVETHLQQPQQTLQQQQQTQTP